MTRLNVAEAKRQFSDLLGRVAFGGETIEITRRGKPMARLTPVEATRGTHPLGDVVGWLEDDDPFFATVDAIVEARFSKLPRILRDSAGRDRE